MASAITQAPEGSNNSIARIVNVLFSPKETFASIAQRPTWLAPVILSCIVALISASVLTTRVGWAQIINRQIQNNPTQAQRFDQLPPEQRAQQLNVIGKIYEVIAFAGAVVFPFLFTLMFAAIFLGLFKLVYGAQIDLKTCMGVVSYAFVPLLIYRIVGTFVSFIKDPAQVDIQNLVASNPGALMSTETARWLVVLATQFDFFTIWVIILLAMGFRAASPKKISFGGALGGIIGLWLFWVIIITGITALTS